ncbi:hypothetical protein [Galbibacter mesophilus]|uniref:hypothetical protein n=1 Tax=Galbibacter mesophilus TaxID=379069 RepID=UPI00191CFD6B|nr:hypothetical protein [Galbibacter mesophilus]MCM5663196.1 hypothetical protein [Galbibacter mesophilus]
MRKRYYSDALDANTVLGYKFKNVKQYQYYLNRFNEIVSTKDIINSKEILASTILLNEDKNESVNLDERKFYDNYKGIIVLSVIVLLVVMDVSTFYIPSFKEWDLYFFTLGSGRFTTVQLFLFVLFRYYLTAFIGLNVWFLTSSYWWKYFLLIPIVLEAYQIISVIFPEDGRFHENEIWKSLPILIVLTIFLIWISLKINNHSKVERLKEKIKVETFRLVALLAETENRNKEIKKEINQLIANKDKYQPKEYLTRLEALQAELLKLKNG